MGYPRAVSNAETNTTSVYAKSSHRPSHPPPTLDSYLYRDLLLPLPSSLIRFSFLYLSIRHQRSSTYLLNTSPVPNLIAVRDTCNEIHQFIQCFLDRTILFIRSKTPFFTTFRLFVSSTIRVHIYIYLVRMLYPNYISILTYKLGIRNDLHRECNEPLQCHLKQKRKKPIFNLYTRDKLISIVKINSWTETER